MLPMTNPFSGERLAAVVLLQSQAEAGARLARGLLGSPCAVTRAHAARLLARSESVLRRLS